MKRRMASGASTKKKKTKEASVDHFEADTAKKDSECEPLSDIPKKDVTQQLAFSLTNNFFLAKKEILLLSVVSSQIHAAVKRIIESFTFRIPAKQKVYIYSPKKVVTSSYCSIPASAIDVCCHLYEPQTDLLAFLPPTLTRLEVDFKGPLNKLPQTLTHLTLGRSFGNLFVDTSLLSSLSLLISTIWVLLPFSVDHPLLPNLTHLTLNGNFKSPLELPQKLTHLTFNDLCYFNEPINLPSTLTHLSLESSRVSDILVASLPSTLTHLTVGETFNQPVNSLPQNLTYFAIKGINDVSTFDHAVDNLPPRLTHLQLAGNYSKPLDKLPSTLTHLYLNDVQQPLNHLPQSLTHLIFNGNSQFNHPLDNLPPNLLYLRVGYQYDQPLNNLPPTLTYLKLHQMYTQRIDNLPKGLCHLELGARFNQPLTKLPNHLTHLYLEHTNFNKPLKSLPKSVTHLVFHWGRQLDVKPIVHCFSASITHLVSMQNQIPISVFPPNLLFLWLDGYEHPIPPFPASLKHLKLSGVKELPPPFPPALSHLELHQNVTHQLVVSQSVEVTRFRYDYTPGISKFNEIFPCYLNKKLF